MQDPRAISAALEARSDGLTARKRARQVQPFRGLRGVALSDVTAILVESWRKSKPALPRDEEVLRDLFMTAFEDGLVAIGLLATLAAESPADVLDVAEDLLALTDDTETADALGWLVLGPALLAAQEPLGEAVLGYKDAPPHRRRAAVMALLAALPVSIEGAAAAALRERYNTKRVQFVEAPLGDEVAAALPAYLRDEAPQVRKAVARVLREWGAAEPDRVEALVEGFPGGLSKQLRGEAERGIRKGRRPKKPRHVPEVDPLDPHFDDV